MTLTGYLDLLSLTQGEQVECKISSSQADVTVDVVRLVHGDDNPRGPGRKIEAVPAISAQQISASLQKTFTGSCVAVEGFELATVLGTRVSIVIQPRFIAGAPVQGIFALTGVTGRTELALQLDADGRLSASAGGRAPVCTLEVPWDHAAWYRVSLGVSAGGQVSLTCQQIGRQGRGWTCVAAQSDLGSQPITGATIGALRCPRVEGQWQPAVCFNGKLENPRVLLVGDDGTESVAADWRFEREPAGNRCIDAGPQAQHGVVVNAPLRAATGHNWNGKEVDFTKTPEQYAAIHFHADDLEDAGWTTSATVRFPADCPPGIYAVRLRSVEEEDVVPVVLRPAKLAARQRIAVLLPTFTYIAYANERMIDRLDFEGDQQSDHPIHPGARDLELAGHPEWGLSLYDVHIDGSTCVYSGHLRPIPNMRPDYRAWLQDAPRHLSADLYLTDWLEQKQYGFDVLTDHDLHREGMSALLGYDVIITGSHPEYVSERILDSLEEHLDRAGSLMYLGGNGFYWVTSQDEDRPHLIEVRRGPVGTRPSEGAPGEGHHSTTGEPGGLWRQRGRWPNKLTGIGMTAQGWDSKAPGYRRTEASRSGELAHLFAGVQEEVLGDFGLIMDGASGDELDRFDIGRGSPKDTVVLASTTGHSDYYQLVGEDVMATRRGLGGSECPDVRSDMTWLDKPAGGSVFSVGSICFTGSLSHNNYENNISTLIGNVIDEMLRRPKDETTT